MEKKDLSIVYMGTPDFAVESLSRLVEEGYHIAGVITMPDKPAGRGHKLQASPVKQYALEHHLPLLQPERLKDETFLAQLRSWHADLQIVVAFRMLPEVVWNMPPMGTFNLHASLLPDYRGAAPINWAVINGETQTGVTTFFLQHEIDTGAILRQERIAIADTDNAGIVHDKLMRLGARLVTQTVDDILGGHVHPIAQEQMAVNGTLHTAPKLFKESCRIHWHQPAKHVYNFIRGLAPYPAAWTTLQLPSGEPLTLKIFEAEVLPYPTEDPSRPAPGTLLTDHKSYLRMAAEDGYLDIRSLQLPGKKRLATDELLRGFRFADAKIVG
ncbi:MAG: methionyl-tRNA formyltransferase [Prevotellaceae bacterium]|jgi:methionyl-tRNA formyltransferase|nr:methionyl-tRNA formyltransferase [Prevotellaceae bacterium]